MRIKKILAWTAGFILGALSIGSQNWLNIIKDVVADVL
jgi:hypothetical protein